MTMCMLQALCMFGTSNVSSRSDTKNENLHNSQMNYDGKSRLSMRLGWFPPRE